MGFGLSLGLSIASIFFFSMFVIFAIKNYQKHFKDIKYDLRNTFPYEINYQMRFTDNVLPNALLSLSLIMSICFFAFFDIKNLNGFTIFILSSGIILSLAIFFMFFADLKYIRLHLLLVTLLGVSSFAVASSISIYGFNIFKNDTSHILELIIAIISVILGLFIFVLMMNPRFNFKLEMKKAVTPEGKEILVRPKYFVMAFSEWLFIFSLFIDQILILILYLPMR